MLHCQKKIIIIIEKYLKSKGLANYLLYKLRGLNFAGFKFSHSNDSH